MVDRSMAGFFLYENGLAFKSVHSPALKEVCQGGGENSGPRTRLPRVA